MFPLLQGLDGQQRLSVGRCCQQASGRQGRPRGQDGMRGSDWAGVDYLASVVLRTASKIGPVNSAGTSRSTTELSVSHSRSRNPSRLRHRGLGSRLLFKGNDSR